MILETACRRDFEATHSPSCASTFTNERIVTEDRIAQPRALMALARPPPDRALFEGKIIAQATDASERPEQPVLFGRRRERVAQAARENGAVATPSGYIGWDIKSESDAGTLDSLVIRMLRLND
jgi:hypothetical protein